MGFWSNLFGRSPPSQRASVPACKSPADTQIIGRFVGMGPKARHLGIRPALPWIIGAGVVATVVAGVVIGRGVWNRMAGQRAEARALEAGSAIRVSTNTRDDSLGMKFSFGGYSTLFLEIANGGGDVVQVGDDLLVGDTVLFQGRETDLDTCLGLAFAGGARSFTIVEHGNRPVCTGFTYGTKCFIDDSVGHGYTGTWPTSIGPGQTGKLTQRLSYARHPHMWLATPVFFVSGSGVTPFRLLVTLDSNGQQSIVLPITEDALKRLVNDKSKPMILREWAVGWLAREKAWQTAASFAADRDMELEVRKAAVRGLATQSPPPALESVIALLWDNESPPELQRECYYSLTWSKHATAKAQIQRATEHPNKEVAEDARTYLKKVK